MTPHVVTATVNGEAKRWEYADIDAALKSRNALIEEGASDIVLLIAGHKRVVIPAGGWPGPRQKSEAAD